MPDHLTMSILAMDSYNRGYDVGVTGLGGLPLGSTFLRESSVTDDTDEVEAGFYAIAYQFGPDAPAGLANKVVISYRGTDNIFGLPEQV